LTNSKNSCNLTLNKQYYKGVIKNDPVWAIKIISTLTAELTDFCELDNPRFDRKTFIDATQLTEEEMRLPL
jgi:hypothetical protein